MLNAIYRAETRREPATRLTALALEHLGMVSVDDLLRAQVEGRIPVLKVRELAPLLLQAACEGDQAACKIVRTFATGLAELVSAGLQRFDMSCLPMEVVLSGSIFKGPGKLLEDLIDAEIHQVAPQARLVNARYEPVVGALLCGLEYLGIEIDDKIRANIERTSQEFDLIRIKNSGNQTKEDKTVQ